MGIKLVRYESLRCGAPVELVPHNFLHLGFTVQTKTFRVTTTTTLLSKARAVSNE